jgi:uncharacterized membrane protein
MTPETASRRARAFLLWNLVGIVALVAIVAIAF